MEPGEAVREKPGHKEADDGNHGGNARGLEPALLGKEDVLPTGKYGDRPNCQRENPLPARPEEHEKQDDRDQDCCGKYSFHSGLRIHRWGGLTGSGRRTKRVSEVTFGPGFGERIKGGRLRQCAWDLRTYSGCSNWKPPLGVMDSLLIQRPNSFTAPKTSLAEMGNGPLPA